MMGLTSRFAGFIEEIGGSKKIAVVG